MSAKRIVALVLAAAAAMAGGMLDRVGTSEPAKDGETYVLVSDFHVHAFPGDGALPPWEVAREARRRGLDAVAITNHNQLLGARAAAFFSTGTPLIIVGQEVTAPRFHMAAVGLSKTVDWRLSAKDAIDAVHAQGGVAIAAHPAKPAWRAIGDEALARLDGTEVLHPVMEFLKKGGDDLRTFRERVLRLNPHVAPIGSSDFHFGGGMGRYRTYVLARGFTLEAVLEAVREGRTVASDKNGRLTGRAEHIAVVERHLTRRPRPTGPTIPQRLAAGCVLLALAALVLLKQKGPARIAPNRPDS